MNEKDSVQILRSAINAFLTHFGMDEDEFTKPTFDQARAALAATEQSSVDQPAAEVVGVQRLENESACAIPRIVALNQTLREGTMLYLHPAPRDKLPLDAHELWAAAQLAPGGRLRPCAAA